MDGEWISASGRDAFFRYSLYECSNSEKFCKWNITILVECHDLNDIGKILRIITVPVNMFDI